MKKGLLALIVFIICFVYFTYPFCLVFNDHLASLSGPGDPYLNTWILAWGAHALGTNPLGYFEANIFYPSRLTLAYSEHMFLQSLAALPIRLLSGSLVLPYNFVFFLSLLLCALGAFALAYDLTGSFPASLLSGIVFGFAPFHFSHLDHLQLQAACWIPLTILFLRRFLRNPTRSNAMLAGLFYSFQVLSCTYHAVFLTGAALLLIVFHIALLKHRWKSILKYSVPSLLLVSVLTIPFGLPYFRLSGEPGFERTLFMASNASAEPSSYLKAPEVNRIYGRPGSGLSNPERSLFVGISVLLLSAVAIGAFFVRKKNSRAGLPGAVDLFYFSCVGLTGFLLSLGPSGRVGTAYRFFYDHFIGFKAIRAPARFSVLVLFSVSVLSALGLSVLLRGIRRRSLSTVLAAVAFLALFFEYSNFKIPYFKPLRETPAIYDWLKNQHGDFPVVEIPMHADQKLDTTYMIRSTVHWKKLVNGYSGSRPAYYNGLVETLRNFPDAGSILLLSELKVRFAIVHFDDPDSAPAGSLRAAISDHPSSLVPQAVLGNDAAYEIRVSPEEKQRLLTEMESRKAQRRETQIFDRVKFSPGEVLDFDIQWSGFLKAGQATLTSEEGRTSSGGKTCIYSLRAETSKWFRPIYAGSFEIRSFLDCSTARLVRMEKSQTEGGKRKQDWCSYNPEEHYGMTKDGFRFPWVPDVRDPVSAFFALRAAEIPRGKTIGIEVQDMSKSIAVDISSVGVETISVPAGTYEADKIACVIKRRLSLRPDIPLQLWLSRDRRRLLLKAEVTLPLGHGTITLKSAAPGRETPDIVSPNHQRPQ